MHAGPRPTTTLVHSSVLQRALPSLPFSRRQAPPPAMGAVDHHEEEGGMGGDDTMNLRIAGARAAGGRGRGARVRQQ